LPIDDVASTYALALENSPGGLFNIASAEAVPMRGIAASIGSALGLGRDIRKWPVDEARSVLGMLADALRRTSLSRPPRRGASSAGK